MALVRPMVFGGAVPERRIMPGDLAAGGENLTAGIITTVGAGTWTGAAIASGIIIRSGPVGGYTDTMDISASIISALRGAGATQAGEPDVVPGTTFRLRFINTVAQAMTFAVATNAGVVIGTGGSGVVNVAASLWRDYLVTILNASTQRSMICLTTNGSAVVTFVLPTGVSAFPIGNSPLAINITPGMQMSGTGVPNGTKVLGVTQGVGGIIGVTMDANATATSSVDGVNIAFKPVVQFDGLGSGTL